MRIKAFLLGAVAAAALFAGAWLLVSPSLNRQSDIERQGELLDGVLAAMAEMQAIGNVDDAQTDIITPAVELPMPNENDVAVETPEGEPTAGDDVVSDTEPYIDEPLYSFTPEQQPPEQAPEPLDYTDFPSGITVIGILTIDSIDLRLPIMEGVDEAGLRIAPGRVPQTAAIGEIGNAVIAGHRNYAFGSMFNRLGEVGIGDVIEFQAMSGKVILFEVFEILVIEPGDQIAFIQPQDESIITLYTCTPVRVATHRLLVRAIKI